MRTRIDFIADGIADNLRNGVEVLVKWNVYPPGTTVDPTTGSMQGTPTAREEVVPAFLHFIQPARSEIRQFTEVETGDCMMEYDPNICLEGRQDIRFFIEGQEWSSKPISSLLKETWDAVQGGRRLFKTLLLRRAT